MTGDRPAGEPLEEREHRPDDERPVEAEEMPAEPEFEDAGSPAAALPQAGMSGREVYNVVTDTVAGPNMRLLDNLGQAIAILLSVIVGAVVGWLVAGNPIGAVLGVLAGLTGGVLISGTVLMIVRAIRHSQGRHD